MAKPFYSYYLLGFSTYPVTTGAIFQIRPPLPPPSWGKKVQQSRDPSSRVPSPQGHNQSGKNGNRKMVERAGGCERRRHGVRKWGREERRAESRRQNNRRGKVTKPRANGKTLTIDMNGDASKVSRDWQNRSQLVFFFPQGTRTALHSHALLSSKTHEACYTSLLGGGRQAV